MNASTDKRKIVRLHSDCDMSFYNLNSLIEGIAKINDLSASGISFRTKSKLILGETLHITVSDITPQLNALIEVVLIESRDNNEYQVAAIIQGVKAS